MDDVRLVVIGALVQQQNQNLLRLQQAVDRRRRERRRRDRVVWVRKWILRRPEHGLYNKLMVELRNEDPRAFHHFRRMPPAIFDEVVQRPTPPIDQTRHQLPTKPGTWSQSGNHPTAPGLW
ncbi:hypothetical protein DPMN_050237 [Dreissena polymorpha]|uniref:Uncharacterized protein n=1 Tax=Dreissena polymorpha TaxID=45954 RepID=A0A9D4HMU2_DREPO|nr:hypothetical protein DPMN_050237 [Dreissena polymorpha]